MVSSQAAFAKLAGTHKAVKSVLDDTDEGKRRTGRSKRHFSSEEVLSYFECTAKQVDVLRSDMKDLFGDFDPINTEPECHMVDDMPKHFYREQLEYLVRTIDQIFELRAHSELAVPVNDVPKRVFISHGRASEWREVQSYIEKTLEIPTLELAQQANLGRTILQKLEEESSSCSFAVIVMTGDDKDEEGNPRARENVIHEIGYFQAKYGLSGVALLYEESTNIPSNIHGLAYIPFPKDTVGASFGALTKELKAFYD